MFRQRLGVLGLLLTALTAHGQSMYVSDELVITMRTGPSTQNAIVRNLSSGDVVQVLDDDVDGGYARVRLPNSGDEGWVLTRFLTAQPIARDRLLEAERERATAQQQLTEVEQQLASLSAQLGETRAELDETSSTNSNIAQELDEIRSTSANAIALRDQNENLRRRNNELSQQIDVRTMENTELASRSRQNWFVVGAIVLLVGLLVGLIAPSLRPRRKSTW